MNALRVFNLVSMLKMPSRSGPFGLPPQRTHKDMRASLGDSHERRMQNVAVFLPLALLPSATCLRAAARDATTPLVNPGTTLPVHRSYLHADTHRTSHVALLLPAAELAYRVAGSRARSRAAPLLSCAVAGCLSHGSNLH